MKGYVTYNEVAYKDDEPQVNGGWLKTLVVWAVLGVCSLSAFFIYRLGETWLAIGIVGVTIGATMFIAPQVAFYIYFGWQALDLFFLDPEATGVITPAKVLALFMVLVYVVSFGRIRQRILVSKSVIIIMFVFGLVGLLGTPLALNKLVALKYAGQVLIQVILVAGALHFLDNEKRISSAFFWCFVGGVLASVIMLTTEEIGQFRAMIGESSNAAASALAFTISMVAILGLWNFKKYRKYLLFYVLGSVVLFIAMIRTGSRASLLALFVSPPAGMLIARGVKLSKRVLVPVLLSLVIVLGSIYVLSLRIIEAQSQQRLEEMIKTGRAESGSGGERMGILRRVIATYFEHHAAFGWGFGNSNIAMQLYRSEKRDIHNSFLGPLVDAGPIGFILFNTGLLLLYLKIRGISDPGMNASASIIYVFLILSAISQQTHFTKWFWIPFTMCLLLAEQSKRKELEEYSKLEYETLEVDYGESEREA